MHRAGRRISGGIRSVTHFRRDAAGSVILLTCWAWLDACADGRRKGRRVGRMRRGASARRNEDILVRTPLLQSAGLDVELALRLHVGGEIVRKLRRLREL